MLTPIEVQEHERDDRQRRDRRSDTSERFQADIDKLQIHHQASGGVVRRSCLR